MGTWATIAALVVAVIGGALVYATATGRWRTLTPEADALQWVGVTLVLLGVVLGDHHHIGTALIGTGVVSSLVSLYRRRSPA
ncbi:MAG: hypothetical protein ACOYEW_05860 [Anaerolineae bacterium]|jgi:hypothetical protein